MTDNGKDANAGSNDGMAIHGSPDSDNGSVAQGQQPVSETDTGSGTEVGSESNRGIDDQRVVTTTSPRDLLSARPFVRGSRLWRDKGWLGTIPLPARSKNPPPVGWTGRAAGFADNAQISEWARLSQYKKGNIGLHLGWPIEINSKEYEVIGIDVDNYPDNGKLKTGGQQLSALETSLGRLPGTLVSTARAGKGDYVSGIRFFLVPRGLAFRGQVDRDIEVIQKKHRFAVVWPSYNPKSDSQYCLYSADSWESQGEPLHEVPEVTTLPFLPDKWIDYLTNGRMMDADDGIDMESTLDEIEEWAIEQFNEADDPCIIMKRAVKAWRKQITDEATSHDKVRDAHWEIINLGAEGHTGWSSALQAIDKHWIEDVMSRSKRTPHEMRMEMFRSRVNALRKVKVKVENAESAGAVYTLPECVCVQRAAITANAGPGGNAGGLFISDEDVDNDSGGPPDGLEAISWGNSNDPDSYERNDDGNGEFLADLLRYKANRVKWVEGYGWIVWTDATPERPSRWLHDRDGLVRRAFWRVKRHQEAFADAKGVEADQMWAQTGNIMPLPANVKAARAVAKMWAEWATRSGNNRQAENAIDAAKNFPGVAMDINELNQSPYLLGVANGVVELRTDGAILRDAEANDFVTFNTGVPWTGWNGISEHDRGRKLWQEYLDKFVPVSRRSDYQAILGHCIIGGNPERLLICLAGGTSTGKSTMLRALGAALGDYSSTVNLTIFGDHKLNPALANAMPKRVVFMSELSDGDKIAVSTVKRMTGNDHVRAELKGSNVEIQGVPQFVPVMATNTPPEIVGADAALRRRLLVLPFDQRIDDHKDEKRAAAELEEHAAEAILAWLVEGYNMYCRLGIPRNLEVETATNEFASHLDHVGEFITERIRKAASEDHIGVAELFGAYRVWCENTNQDRRDVLSQHKLTSRLKGLGYEQKAIKIGGKTQKRWIGMKMTMRIAGSQAQGFKVVTDKEANDAKDS